MFPTVERPRITEIQVRIDCNGCVQKIKKALHGINGIYDLYIDLPQQKLTIVGWADPEKIIKAIKKTRKTATICTHSEVQDPPPGLPSEPPPPPHPPRDQPPPHHPPHHPREEEVHVIHHHHPPTLNTGYGPGYGPGPGQSQDYDPRPHSQGYNPGPPDYGQGYPSSSYRPEMVQPVHVIHNYHQHRPPAYVTYVRSPARYSPYDRMNYYYDYNNDGYHNDVDDENMLNEENVNTCTIC